jgi:hypothetical protein
MSLMVPIPFTGSNTTEAERIEFLGRQASRGEKGCQCMTLLAPFPVEQRRLKCDPFIEVADFPASSSAAVSAFTWV